MVRAGPLYHFIGFIEADNSGTGPSLAQNLSAVSRAAADIDNGLGVCQRDPRNEIDGWLRSFMLELQILFRVPFTHCALPSLRPYILSHRETQLLYHKGHDTYNISWQQYTSNAGQY
jgi:hypothetical protein